jgi:hypothetical protein
MKSWSNGSPPSCWPDEVRDAAAFEEGREGLWSALGELDETRKGIGDGTPGPRPHVAARATRRVSETVLARARREYRGVALPIGSHAALTGHWTCVDPGSVANDGGCDLGGSGDQQCISGICGAADVMGLLTLGMCGECEVDGDCGPAEVCNPAQVDLALGLMGAECL